MANSLTVNDKITPSLKKIKANLSKLPKEAYAFFVEQTPVKSGNARRKTTLSQETIKARYPYASELDSGRSDQAPDGMIKPTENFIKKRSKQIVRK